MHTNVKLSTTSNIHAYKNAILIFSPKAKSELCSLIGSLNISQELKV